MTLTLLLKRFTSSCFTEEKFKQQLSVANKAAFLTPVV